MPGARLKSLAVCDGLPEIKMYPSALALDTRLSAGMTSYLYKQRRAEQRNPV